MSMCQPSGKVTQKKPQHPSPALRQWSRFPALKRLAPLFFPPAADEAERSCSYLGCHKFGVLVPLESGTRNHPRVPFSAPPRRAPANAPAKFEEKLNASTSPTTKGLLDGGVEELLCKCVGGEETQDVLFKH